MVSARSIFGLLWWICVMSDEPIPCRLCKCLIFFSENKISQTGKMIPINFTDGKGGKRGENHNCRPTYEPIDPRTIDMHVFCNSCLTYYDRREVPWCPCCFKIQCKSCGGLWIATIFNMVAIDPDGEVMRDCPWCGSMDYKMIEDIESWKKAWDNREEMVGLLKCKNCKGKNWISPAPIRYRRSTKNKDPYKPTTIVSFVEDLPYRNWWK